MIHILMTVMTFVATYLFSFWLVFVLLFGPRVPPWIQLPGSLGLAALAATFVFRRLRPREGRPRGRPGLGGATVMGALCVGAIGFVVGFFGPMIIDPGANQGPMLGIFITGPLGVIVGAVGGAAYWFLTKNDA